MKLIIFDVDGTLVYSNKIDSKSFAQAYREKFNKSFPSINWNDYPHVTDETIFETVFYNHFNRKAEPTEIQDFKNIYVDILEQNRASRPEDFKQVSNATNAINQLLEMDGYSVGIATGGWSRPAQVKLKHVGIDHRRLHCGYADNNFTREDIINEALDNAEKHLEKIERIVYIGDANWDVTTTRNMSIPFVGIRFKGDKEVLHDLGASHVITDYNDFDLFLDILDAAEVPLGDNR